MPDLAPERTRDIRRASWIFGSLFALALLVILFVPMDHLTSAQERVLAVLTALAAGLFGFFLTGAVIVQRKTVQAAGGVALFVLVLVWWLSPWEAREPEAPVLLMVQAVDEVGRPVEGGRLTSSLEGEITETPSGWKVAIPRQRVRNQDSVEFTVAHPERRLLGSKSVSLSGEQQAVRIQLAREPGAPIAGTVVDQDGGAVPGARVSLVGGSTTTSGADGGFWLPTKTPEGEIVRLRVEKEGFRPFTLDHPTGGLPATLELHRLEGKEQ